MSMPSPGDTEPIPHSMPGTSTDPPATGAVSTSVAMDRPLDWLAALTPFRTLDDFLNRLLRIPPVVEEGCAAAFVCQPAGCLAPRLSFLNARLQLQHRSLDGCGLSEEELSSAYRGATGEETGRVVRLAEPARNAWWIVSAKSSSGPSEEVVSVVSQLAATAIEVNRDLWERRLEAIAEFSAGAGHEINNPLGTIIGRAGQLLRGESDPERRRMLETIGSQAYRARDMIGDAMLFARPPAPEPQLLDVSQVLDRVLESFRESLAEGRMTLLRSEANGLSIWADEVQLKVVLSELVRNAMTAMSVGGTLSITTCPDEVQGVPHAQMRLANDGRALSAEEREHMFDPFYSGRDAGRGLGFGLAKCWRIVQMHGGQIAVESTEAGGTTILMRWPAVEC